MIIRKWTHEDFLRLKSDLTKKILSGEWQKPGIFRIGCKPKLRKPATNQFQREPWYIALKRNMPKAVRTYSK